jgi:hypothetical protein
LKKIQKKKKEKENYKPRGGPNGGGSSELKIILKKNEKGIANSVESKQEGLWEVPLGGASDT